MAREPRSQPRLQLHNPKSSYNVYHAVRASVPDVKDPVERARNEALAIERCCDIRLHQSFLLPPNPANGRKTPLRVTYSDVGASPDSDLNDDGEEVPVLLWASGMFGGRYAAVELDELAKSHGVRFVSVDRPGIGGTGQVSLQSRIETWLEIVPALMHHLGIKKISLGCHSCGTIYVLSTVIRLRHLLHPDRPYIAMFGPWIPPNSSGKWDMKIVSSLPKSWLAQWHHVAKTVYNLSPLFEASSGFFRKSVGVVAAPHNQVDAHSALGSINAFSEEGPKSDEDHVVHLRHGPLFPQELLVQASRFITTSIFNENIEGASDEALLSMGKAGTSWTGPGDAIQQIVSQELSRIALENTQQESRRARLKVDVFYAAKDEMSGKGGQDYLESFLQKAEQQNAIKSISLVIQNTDHNTVLSPETGAFDLVFRTVSGIVVCGETVTDSL